MLHELRRHADARVLDAELIVGAAGGGAALLRYADADRAARLGVLDGIAQQVQQDLVQPQAVAVDVLVHHVHRVHIEVQLLGHSERR